MIQEEEDSQIRTNTPCMCVPKWLREFASRAFQDNCSRCDTNFLEHQFRLATTRMIPCSYKHGRVHAFLIILHEECAADFEEDMHAKKTRFIMR